jgi:hypothetical protein
MKRLTLLLLGLALGVATTAKAQGLTMQMSNGWSFSFSGNVNAFWVFTAQNNSGPKNSSVRTGLLPAFATFEAKGKEAGMTLGIHFGFAPQINTGAAHDHFGPDAAGAQIDMRQVYMTVGFSDGSQILAGRELGLFARQNIVQDMTLFGVGAVGIGNAKGRGTTLGRIGYGYPYANFVSQLTYSSKGGQPAQFSVGLFEPSSLGSGTYTFTTIPRVEAEFTYNQKSGGNSWLVWAGGLWQSTSNAPTNGTSVSSIAGTAGIKGSFSDLSLVVSGYIGKGIGTTLLFSGGEVIAGDTLSTSDGGYAQLMFKVDPKTSLGASWGFSRLKGRNSSVVSNWTSTTLGLYHQWTKSLKLVFEGTREQVGNGSGAPSQIDVSGGLMLFF